MIGRKRSFKSASVSTALMLHLLREQSAALDWPRLLMRFGDSGGCSESHHPVRVRLPGQAGERAAWVMDELTRRLSVSRPNLQSDVCYGTLLRANSTLHDIDRWKYATPANSQKGR